MRFLAPWLVLSACAPRDSAEIALRRLTPTEYNETVRDLYGMPPDGWVEGVDLDWEADTFVAPWPWAFPEDQPLDGFDGMPEGQIVSPLYVEQVDAAAAHFARWAPIAPRFWTCDPAESPDRRACAEESALRLARRAWRRPLTREEERRWSDRFVAWDTRFGTDVAIERTARALLQSPQFLYRVEPDARSGAKLDDYALASRMSYFLWDSMPDDALFQAAAKGLGERSVRAEAERMLGDPRAREMVTQMHRRWLELDGLQRQATDLETHGARYAPELVAPGFDVLWAEELWSAVLNGSRAALLAEVDLFVEGVVFDGTGTLTELLTSRAGWVATVRSEDIDFGTAPIYGDSAPMDGPIRRVDAEDGNFGYGITLRPVQHPEGQRAGVLTLGAVLAARAHPIDPAPILRGTFVLDRLICQDLGSPPAGVSLTTPPGLEDATNRARLEALTGQPPCSACHTRINPLGFAFEAYDALGGWRTEDRGQPIDSSGVLQIPGEPDRPFAGAVDLAQHLAASPRVRDCYATRWARVATGDPEIALDDPRFLEVRERFRASDSIPALLVDLLTTDALLRRGATP